MCKKDTVKICMDMFVKTYQPDQWDEYQRNKQKDSSDSEDEGDDTRKDSQEIKKEGKDEIKKKLKLSDLTIEIDDNIPLSKVKELLTR